MRDHAHYTAATLGDHLEAVRKLPMYQRAQEAETLMRGVQTILARQEAEIAQLQTAVLNLTNYVLGPDPEESQEEENHG